MKPAHTFTHTHIQREKDWLLTHTRPVFARHQSVCPVLACSLGNRKHTNVDMCAGLFASLLTYQYPSRSLGGIGGTAEGHICESRHALYCTHDWSAISHTYIVPRARKQHIDEYFVSLTIDFQLTSSLVQSIPTHTPVCMYV